MQQTSKDAAVDLLLPGLPHRGGWGMRCLKQWTDSRFDWPFFSTSGQAVLQYTSHLSSLHAGPVDGAAIFTKCTGCQVAVACQQFQARNCNDIEFGAPNVAGQRPLMTPALQTESCCVAGLAFSSLGWATG